MCGGGIGKIVKMALPIAGAYVGGPLLGGGLLGAGLGSAGGTLVAGGSPKEALFSGLTSAAGSFIGSQLPSFGSFFEGTSLPGADALPGFPATIGPGAATPGTAISGASLGGGGFLDDLTSVGDFTGGLASSPTAATLLAPPGVAAPAWSSGVAREALAAPGETPPMDISGYLRKINQPAAGGSAMPTSPQGYFDPAQLEAAIPGIDTGVSQIGGVTPTAAPGAAQPLPSTEIPQLGTGAYPYPTGPLADMLDSLGMDTTSGVGKLIASNPKAVISALGMGYSAMQPEPESMGELRDLARQTAGQGQILTNYLQSGTLPPGAQESVDEGKRAAIAAVRSKYSTLGLSGSTMEMDAIQSIESRAEQQAFSFAAQLLDSGLRSTGLSSNIYNYLINAEQTDDQAFAQALGSFTGAIAPNPQGA